MADAIIENIYLVNAPAGSGKTTTIRKMVNKHLQEHPKDNILCITYTNRAAEELGKDIDSKNVFFGTIHSFISHFISSLFLHKEILELYWKCYKDEIKKRIVNAEEKKNISESNDKYIEKYGKLDLETVRGNITKVTYNETAFNSLYRGGLSHDDLISFTKEVVDKYPIIRRKIADKYQLIFIDEYQDTSADVLFLFYDAIKESNSKMFLLGDKMQQIYKTYNGAFEKEFKGLNTSLNLRTNYRSTPKIISILNNIYNVDEYNQYPFEKSNDEVMDYSPEVIITDRIEGAIETKKEKYPKALVLYLLNKERFRSVNAEELYDTVSKMGKYSFEKKYGAMDVLTDLSDKNPDKLFYLLFLICGIYTDYKDCLYGRIISRFRKYKKIFNARTCFISKHEDKARLQRLIEKGLSVYNDDQAKIIDLLNEIKAIELINAEYLDEILGDEDYVNTLNVRLIEFRNLAKYLAEPHISTQHGVKGESHDTVIFVVADNNRTPVVHMKKFFELWSECNVCLPEFEEFYYSFKDLLSDIEVSTGIHNSDLKADNYENKKNVIINKITMFKNLHRNNPYFTNLCKDEIDKFLERSNVTNVKKCLKENLVYGALSAYRLFYVGCSRAKRNLTIIINKKDIVGFEQKLREKLETCGFRIIQVEDGQYAKNKILK